MSIDLGRLFSISWETLKQRFWLLVAMVLIYVVVQMVASSVLSVVLGMGALAAGTAAGGFDNPDAGIMGGLGIGFVIFMLLFYVALIVLYLAQMGSMAAQATPLYKLDFGQALMAGLKSSLTMLGLCLLLIAAYFVFALCMGLFIGLGAAVGEEAGTGLAVIAVVLFLPVLIYVSLRLSVIIQVIVVDGVTNPITAIAKCWEITRGHALSIFVIYVIITIGALVALGIPMLMMFGPMFASLAQVGASGAPEPDLAAGAIGGIIIGSLLLIPLSILYAIVQTVIVSCLHAEISDTGTAQVEETFG